MEELKPKVVEIDLVDIARKLWNKRKFIVKVTCCFFAFGVLVAFLSPKEYTSSIVMVPQSSDAGTKLGGLSGLASMAGINLSDMGGDQSISPTLYPQIMGSITFQKELMQTKVKFENISEPISIFDYFTKDEYKYNSFSSKLLKYSIGLPSLLLHKIKPKTNKSVLDSVYIYMTEDEQNVIKVLNDNLSLVLNDEDGYITILAKASEPLVANQIAIAAQILLQKYITNIKVAKAQENLDFIEGRYFETKKNYELTLQQLASFQDNNQNVISAIFKTQEQKRVNEFNLAFSVYSEMTKQLEQAKIKVKDATPVLTVVQPAYVPFEKTKPKRAFIIFLYLFFGFVLSSFYLVFRFQFLSKK